jgi:hypothetical protein
VELVSEESASCGSVSFPEQAIVPKASTEISAMDFRRRLVIRGRWTLFLTMLLFLTVCEMDEIGGYCGGASRERSGSYQVKDVVRAS